MVLEDFTERSSNEPFCFNLLIDFETELENLLKPEEEDRSDKRDPSKLSCVRYNADGSIYCSDIYRSSLREISGCDNLNDLKNLSISVACRNTCENLSVLNYLTRSLTVLTLDFSKIESLRVLGDEIVSLKSLSVNSCNLVDLDGISYVPNLTHLVAADNSITDLLPVTDLRKINSIDLENNSINNYDSLSFLCLCPKLEHLILLGNPISRDEEYRLRIFSYIKSLRTLDVDVENRQRTCRSFSNRRNPSNNNDPDDKAFAVPSKFTNDINDELIQKLTHQKSEEDNLSDIHNEEKSGTENEKSDEDEKKDLESPQVDLKIEESFKSASEQAINNDPCPVNLNSSSKLLVRRKSLDPIKLKREETENEKSRPDSSSSCNTINSTDSGICETSYCKSFGDHLPSLRSSPKRKADVDISCSDKKQWQIPTRQLTTTYNKSSLSKLLRQDSDLNGKLTKEGDIEIEDFENSL